LGGTTLQTLNAYQSVNSPLLFEIKFWAFFSSYSQTFYSPNSATVSSEQVTFGTDYSTVSTEINGVLTQAASLLQENATDQRFTRSANPVFRYDFKVGNYMPDDAKKLNPHLFNTIKDVTTGIRKSA